MLLVLVLGYCASASADDLSNWLNQNYRGKVFAVRNFWKGDQLQYDAAGQIEGQADIGFWTTDGFVEVKKISLAGKQLRLQCKRLIIIEWLDGLNYTDAAQKISHRDLFINLGDQAPTSEQISAVLAKVFVSDENEFLAELPEYWKSCFDAASHPPNKSTPGCHLAPRVVDAFGSSAPAPSLSTKSEGNLESTSKASTATSSAPVGMKVAGGMSPPRVLHAPEPQYSEAALLAGLSGISFLRLTVDATGRPRDIRIARPLGYGLDEQAILAVENWRFDPGRKNGQPVAVAIMVEVTFRMR